VTSVTAHRPEERHQLRALRSAFLTRFFDNEITGGSNDLKASFFWLVGFLAAPGFLIAIMMMWQWDTIARFQGVAALRESAMSSKLVYLSYGMVASGLLAAMTWTSLLLDRRDALVLGALPVRPRTIVGSKLGALAAYLGLLTIAMHGLASLTFGTVLASHNTFSFLLRGVVAHLVAGGVSSTFLFLAVTSAQGVALALTGPRAFTRVSSALQVGLIACVLIGFVVQPLFAVATLDTLAGAGRRNHPWMLYTPPFWFLGTYEWLLGTEHPGLIALHWRGVAVLASLAGLTSVSYVASYARLSRAAVEGGDAALPRPKAAALVEGLVKRLTARPASRAAAQFFLVSLARVERLRFAAAMAIGVVVGWSIPAIYLWAQKRADPAENAIDPFGPGTVLALSLADVAFLVAGLRVAASLPSDLKASWIIPMIDAPVTQLRSGLWRVLFATGVVPIAVLFAPLIAWFWGAQTAVGHTLVLLAGGALLIELLLWNHEQMPNAGPWRPERVQFGKRWPLYLLGFLLFSAGMAALEGLVLGEVWRIASLVGFLILATVGIRLAHERRQVIPEDDLDNLGAPAVLRID